MQQKDNKEPVHVVVGAVLFYIVTSITMVLVNKLVLVQIDLPILLLWSQMVMAVLLLLVCHFSGIVTLPVDTSLRTQKGCCDWRWPEVSFSKSKRMWKLILVNVVGLIANTYCLKLIDASLFQVARSLVLPFTVLFQYLFLNQPSTFRILFSCLLVCLGFLAGLFGDQSSSRPVSLQAILFGIFSSLTTAYHAIVIKSSLSITEGNTMELVWYNNILSSLVCFPLIFIFGEIGVLSTFIQASRMEGFAGDNARQGLQYVLWGTFITGIFGFLINLAGFFQIKVTSPVSHMISSAFRGVLQTLLAVWLFDDILTTSRVSGILLILVGSSLYTYYKSQPIVLTGSKEDVDVEMQSKEQD